MGAGGDKFALTGNLRFTDSTTEFDSVDFFTTGLPIDAPNRTDSEQIYASLSLDWDSFESRLQHRVTLALTDTDNENDTGGTVNDVTRGTRQQIQYQGDLQVEHQIVSLTSRRRIFHHGVFGGFAAFKRFEFLGLHGKEPVESAKRNPVGTEDTLFEKDDHSPVRHQSA